MLTLGGPVQDVPKYKMKRKFAEGSRQSLGRVRRRDQEGPVAECTSCHHIAIRRVETRWMMRLALGAGDTAGTGTGKACFVVGLG